ncbi:MAG: hypothetical protein NWR91_04585 [Schleiferiaceae bacterium]|nr:hypothetical protein [Schleiferiaceae bacterium]
MLQLTAAYAALASISALALTAWGIPWYALGYLWISVSGITVFFFAFAFERKRPKTFIWVILGGGMLRMLLGVATVVLPLSMRQPEGYKADALQFAAIFILAQAIETWFAVQRVNRL